MPAYRGGDRAAWSLKEIVIAPDNSARGLDSHQGAVLLHDGETGELRALLNASAVTEIRTAAVSAVATRALARAFAGRRAPVKAALLDQRAAAGLGNIYVDEALWRARVHPLRPAGELRQAELAALRKGIRQALEMGIARQGASLRDYRDPSGRRGTMQDDFRVYGRAGEPCARCGTPIEKIRAGGRGTWYCPRCQPFQPR